MARDSVGPRIESLIREEDWKRARKAITVELRRDPESHWLWSRLSAVKYEQRDYRGALEAAGRALEIVPDCPLALWSKAGALEMLDKPKDALRLYTQLFERGSGQLKNPDEDALECWEGPAWTAGLIADCLFRAAGCLATLGDRSGAVNYYLRFLNFRDLGAQGIYTREDARKELKKLMPRAEDKRAAAVEVIEREVIAG